MKTENDFLPLDPNNTQGAGEAEPPAPSLPQLWWTGLVRCNPFYLFSALLLIYGIYRASVDPQFLATDTRQLIFNFGSLEIYSLMLVGTAVFLARRRIWYDATMLVFLGNILVLIPFMLVSHAVFLGKGLAWVICLVGSVAAGVKFGAFKRLIPRLNLPWELLAAGVLILGVNVAVPLLFRKGLDTDNELWLARSEHFWLVVIPLLVLLGHILPRQESPEDETAPHEQRWLPLMMFALWITGTGMHLFTVGYVDDQKFQIWQVSAIAWAGSWLLANRLGDFAPACREWWGDKLLLLPVAGTSVAWFSGRGDVFILLNGLNAVMFGCIYLRNASVTVAVKLAGASVLAAFLAVPEAPVREVVQGYSKWHMVFGTLAAAGIFLSLRSRQARGGLLGGGCVAVLLAGWKPENLHFAMQGACLFVLLHSLRWSEPRERGSGVLFGIVALAWVADSWMLQAAEGLKWVPLAGAGLGLAAAAFRGLFQRETLALTLVCAAVLMTQPVLASAAGLREAPPALLALAASFGLFLAGTAFALWKRKCGAVQTE